MDTRSQLVAIGLVSVLATVLISWYNDGSEWLAANWHHVCFILVPNMILVYGYYRWHKARRHRAAGWTGAARSTKSIKSTSSSSSASPNSPSTAIRASDSADVSESSLGSSALTRGECKPVAAGDRGPGCLDPKFSVLLAPYDIDNLTTSPHTIYGVWADDNLTLGYANSGWFQHARSNGGKEPYFYRPMGMSILGSMPGVLRDFFASNFRRVTQEQRPWEHVYECSSPDSYRLLHMMVFPLRFSASLHQPRAIRAGSSPPSTSSSISNDSYTGAATDGLLVVHSLRVERPHDRLPLPPLDHLYRDSNGFVQQCVHCRRVLRQPSARSKALAMRALEKSKKGDIPAAEDAGTWDWIPAWLHRPLPRTTHGTCQPCSQFYFNDARMELSTDQFPPSFVTGEITQYPPASLPPSPEVDRWTQQWRRGRSPQR